MEKTTSFVFNMNKLISTVYQTNDGIVVGSTKHPTLMMGQSAVGYNFYFYFSLPFPQFWKNFVLKTRKKQQPYSFKIEL